MADPHEPKPLTYASYLEIDALLALQRPRSEGPEHDEMLFIIIHQVYELWFRQILHELGHLQSALDEANTAVALGTLKRILTILKTLVAQVDILETMTPTSFNSFRSRLEAASGFQSAQFREVEFVLGQKSLDRLRHHPEGSAGRQRLTEMLDRPGVWDSFLRYLSRIGHSIPDELLHRDVRQLCPASPAVQEVLLRIYREDPFAEQVCERLIDLDEGLQEWRYRHLKMVERTIGGKIGTGGSAGADYLRTTLFSPLFPDLWAIRDRL